MPATWLSLPRRLLALSILTLIGREHGERVCKAAGRSCGAQRRLITAQESTRLQRHLRQMLMAELSSGCRCSKQTLQALLEGGGSGETAPSTKWLMEPSAQDSWYSSEAWQLSCEVLFSMAHSLHAFSCCASKLPLMTLSHIEPYLVLGAAAPARVAPPSTLSAPL